MKEYLIKELDKWQAGRNDSNWSKLGRIFSDRLNECKRSVSRMANADNDISIKDKISFNKCHYFSEIRAILDKY